MLDREEMKIRNEWKKLEESFNSMTLNSIAEGEPVPQEAYMQLNDSDVVVNSVKEVPKSRFEDSEPYEAPSGPTYSSGGEPGSPGYYTAGYTVVADVTVSVVMSNGQPVSMSDPGKMEEFKSNFDYQQELTDTVIPYVEDDVEPGYRQDKEADGWGIKVLKMEPTAEGKIHFVFTLQVSTNEAPEVEPNIPDEDWGDERFEEKVQLLNVAGKLLKEASRHLK
jgi:hypothetical protein